MRLYSASESFDLEASEQAPGPADPLKSSFAGFWQRRGRRVFEAAGALWGHHKGPFYTCFPQDLRIDASSDELREVFHRGRVKGLRVPSAGLPGLPNGLYVLRPAGYSLKSVNQRQRGHIKRGMDACEIRRMDPDELAAWGLDLNHDTLARQHRDEEDFLDPVKWKRLVKAIEDTPAMAIHGAFVDGKLASYLVSCREGEWIHMIYGMSRTHLGEFFPTHALDFAFITEAAGDPNIRFISNGCASTLPNEGLDRFKRQMGYQLAPQNLRIHFHPLLAPLLGNRMVKGLSQTLQSLMPRSERITYSAKILEGAYLSRS